MKIQTTVNLDEMSKTKLLRAASFSGKTCSYLAILVLNRIAQIQKRPIIHKRSVEYQKGTGKKKWRRLHISMESRDYEQFLDMRKFFKKSVSLLLASAIDLYLDDILKCIHESSENQKITDNYRSPHYIFFMDEVNGALRWTIYWGLPTNYHEILIL